MSRERLAVMVEHQAQACADLGSGLYPALLTRIAEDIRAQGPCADAMAGFENARHRDAVALRLLGGVHALALTGRAGELAAHYPSTGGTFDAKRPDACWPAFRATVAGELPWIREWMTRPPQTNEVGRANLLVTGLLRVAACFPFPIRLFELGSSAGLNLRADRFRYTSGEFAWGPAGSPVVLSDAWRGDPPDWLTGAAAAYPTLTITERHGCDPDPVDPLSPEGILALRAYLWPDQRARADRLEGALRLAAEVPARVDAVGAAEFLAGIEPEPGTLTVVWHSIMRQYVPPAEWSAVEREIERLAVAGTPEAAFAHISFEPQRVGTEHRFRLAVRAGSADRGIQLADASAHGIPARAM